MWIFHINHLYERHKMNPEFYIEIIMRDHRGKENAIARERLRKILLYVYNINLTDRMLRRIVKTMPEICSCEHGYYLADNQSDYDDAIEYFKKKIYPLWTDIKNLQTAYPEYSKGDEQLNLFEGNLRG